MFIFVTYADAKSCTTGGLSGVQVGTLTSKSCGVRPSMPTLLHFVPLFSSYLQNRIGEQQTITDNLQLLCSWTGDCVILQDLLGCFCLPSSTLPRDEDEMVVVLTAHHPVGVVSYGISEQGSQEVFREASIRIGKRRQSIKGFSEVLTPCLTLQALYTELRT